MTPDVSSKVQSRYVVLWVFCIIATFIVCLSPWLGLLTIWPQNLLSSDPQFLENRYIFFQMRLPRMIVAMSVGAVLSYGGAAYQTVFRNPLVSPFTLGVASGAALGSLLWSVLVSGHFEFITSGQAIAGFIGALLVSLLMDSLCRRGRRPSAEVLLLTGVVIHFMISGWIVLIQSFIDPAEFIQTSRWFLGHIPVLKASVLLSIVSVSGLGLFLLLLRHRELDQLASGRWVALSRGVDVDVILRRTFFLVALPVGWVIAHCGPIGFVGVIIPNVVRRLFGIQHKYVLPLSALGGAVYLVCCDVLSRSLIPPIEIPVGVISALLGGPFFIYVLLHSKEESR